MKSSHRKNPSFYLWAFLVLAVFFLAVGLGTLGSRDDLGDPYELYAKKGDSEFSVVFQLGDIKTKDEKGDTVTTYLSIYDVYLNVASIYGETDKNASITLTRSSSYTSFPTSDSYVYNAELENLFPETVEEGTVKKNPVISEAVGQWVRPFKNRLVDTAHTEYSVSTYKYYKLTTTGSNLLINEVVFLGKVLDGSGGTPVEGEPYVVIPCTIQNATQLGNESKSMAIDRAKALIDTHKPTLDSSNRPTFVENAKVLPSEAQSSYYRFTKAELYSMMTIAEMRAGGDYNDLNTYHGDTVYNSLGTSMLALGTAMFGLSPFGLRFFPMLASFGVLIVGFFFASMLFKNEKAGFTFALVYTFCNFSFGLGHIGTPLMIGVFFFLASLFACYTFYAKGMKKGTGVLALVLSGVCGAAAITVNGAYLIPVAGVVGLFVAGLIRQYRARRYYLDLAIAEAEEEEKGKLPPSEDGRPVGKAKVVAVLSEYKRKNSAAIASFATSLVVSGMLFPLIFLIPVFSVASKLAGSTTLNIFVLAARAFAGGYTGNNSVAGLDSDWSLFYTVFRGSGDVYAVTSVVPNIFAFLTGVFGLIYGVSVLVKLLKAGDWKKREFVSACALLGGVAIGLIVAVFAKGALGLLTVANVCAYLLGSGAVTYASSLEGKWGKAAKAVSIVGAVLLVACFALAAVFTFAIPLPASFISKF